MCVYPLFQPQDSLVGQESSRAASARVAASATYYLVQLSTKAGEATVAAHFGKLQVGSWLEYPCWLEAIRGGCVHL